MRAAFPASLVTAVEAAGWSMARSQKSLGSIMHRRDPFLVGTVGTAIEMASGFYSVTHDLASAMIAFRRQRMDGTLEAIKVMRNA